jgi:hypothetical protein
VQPPDGAAQRPVELYYRHLTAALQEAGLQAMVPRHMWPKEVQEKVRVPWHSQSLSTPSPPRCPSHSLFIASFFVLCEVGEGSMGNATLCMQVLSGLKRTVPARLLAMELWASSAGPQTLQSAQLQ